MLHNENKSIWLYGVLIELQGRIMQNYSYVYQMEYETNLVFLDRDYNYNDYN